MNLSAQEEATRRLRNKDVPIALVGASANPQKYGNIILRRLLGFGYSVLPVNPGAKEIEGIQVLAGVGDLVSPIAIVNVVVPPQGGLEVVRDLDAAVCDLIWFQPGAFDEEVIELARAKFPLVIAGDCIMVVAAQFGRK